MQVNVYGLNGEVKKKVDLPSSFSVSYRPRLIQRAVLSAQSARLQPQGNDVDAGRKYTALYVGRRKMRNSIMGHGVARKPRLKNRRRLIEGQVAGIPGTVGGPKAHSPVVEKVIHEKINKKERLLALKSALSALSNKDLILKRGHKFNTDLTFPLVVESSLENLDKTSQVYSFLEKLGLNLDVERAKDKKTVRAGIGTMRGRRYRRAKSILFVTSSENSKLFRAARNLEGVDVVNVRNISVEDIAPAGNSARLTVFVEDSLNKLE